MSTFSLGQPADWTITTRNGEIHLVLNAAAEFWAINEEKNWGVCLGTSSAELAALSTIVQKAQKLVSTGERVEDWLPTNETICNS